MKTHLAAAALVAWFAQPAAAITFPSLTTIYVGSGVRDDGGIPEAGTATTFHCSNVSGAGTTVRFLILDHTGGLDTALTRAIAHGQTITVSTHSVKAYIESNDLETGILREGVINIESLESGVFCNAKTIDAASDSPVGTILPLVRVNPHPGTVE